VIMFLLNTNPKIGNLEAYNSKVFFINTPEKQADYQNHKAAFYYNPYFGDKNFKSEKGSQENRQASALLDSALQVAPMHPATYLNCLIRDYNYTLHELRDSKSSGGGARLRPLQSRVVFAEQLIMNDSLNGKPNTDSLRAHFSRLKSQFYFSRWVFSNADKNAAQAEQFRSRMDTLQLEEQQRAVLRESKKRWP
jgi:hypothetical protein